MEEVNVQFQTEISGMTTFKYSSSHVRLQRNIKREAVIIVVVRRFWVTLEDNKSWFVNIFNTYRSSGSREKLGAQRRVGALGALTHSICMQQRESELRAERSGPVNYKSVRWISGGYSPYEIRGSHT